MIPHANIYKCHGWHSRCFKHICKFLGHFLVKVSPLLLIFNSIHCIVLLYLSEIISYYELAEFLAAHQQAGNNYNAISTELSQWFTV